MAQQPSAVAPSAANGAQVPLEDFNIPQFPREAGGLMALTFTSQIKLDDYSAVLKLPFKVTHLPPSIQSLTLELFAAGYPAGFLKALIAELPELRSLVAYAQTFTGSSNETIEDAVAFIKGAKKLRALHLLDAFVAPAFLKGIAPSIKQLEKPLMFLEVNYTNQALDQDFMSRIPAAELPLLIHPGVISCSFNIAAPENLTDQDQDGIRVLDSKYSEALVNALLDDESAPQVMKHLNVTLYLMTTSQLRQVVAKHKGLMVLNVSIIPGDGGKWKTDVLNALAAGENLEQVEIVLCPAVGTTEPEITIEPQTLPVVSEMCKKLESFKVNQLRCQKSKTSVECYKAGGQWKIDVKEVQASELPKLSETVNSKAVSR
jgi:hypothetical protein